MHTKRELLDLLRSHHLRLKKPLGQHYLIDVPLTRRLVEWCDIRPTDTVIEIGAGLGALTDLLARRAACVIAVEIDRAIAGLLKTRLRHCPNVTVACEDILTWPWTRYQGSKVVGAIPYQVSSPILVSLCEQWPHLPEAWLSLQHEVAQRLIAKPGTKAYGRLSILVQFRFEVRQLMRVPRRAFFPPPRVDSAWVHLRARRSLAVSVEDETLLFDVVKAAFGQRRKTLLNGLRTLRFPQLDRDGALSIIRQAGLPDQVRGEELSLAAFATLTNVLHRAKTA